MCRIGERSREQQEEEEEKAIHSYQGAERRGCLNMKLLSYVEKTKKK